MRRSHPAVLAGVGLVAGFLSGLLGVGGGIVMVPGLVLLAGLPQHRAHVASLAAIIPIGAVGAAVFAADGRTDLAVAALLAAGAVAGAPVGVRFMTRIPEAALRALFVIGALAAAVRLLI